jgi:hypothetical protein
VPGRVFSGDFGNQNQSKVQFGGCARAFKPKARFSALIRDEGSVQSPFFAHTVPEICETNWPLRAKARV